MYEIKSEEETFDKEQIEIEKIESEEDDYISSPPDYEISAYPADFTFRQIDTGGIAGTLNYFGHEYKKNQWKNKWYQNANRLQQHRKS